MGKGQTGKERGKSAAVRVASASGPAVPAQPSTPQENAPVPADAPLPGNPADPIYGLSARELEVLDLFAQGRSANWIAENLTISKNTVRTHLRAIYSKLDVHSRQELLDFLAGN